MNQKKLIERVKRLYAMAQQQDASPHEAAIALKRCNAMMREHGLTLADLEDSSVIETAAQSHYARRPRWIKMLHSSVAAFHDCAAVVHDLEGDKFVGLEADALSASLTFDYLVGTLNRSVEREQALSRLNGAREASQYRLGFSIGIAVKIKTIIDERVAEQRAAQRAAPLSSGEGNALILTDAKTKKINDYLGPLKVNKTPKINIKNDTALQRGITKGKSVSLNSQIDESKSVKSLGRC